MFAGLKLVLPLADEDTFVLGRDPGTITIREILDCVRNAGKSGKTQGEGGKEEQLVDDLLSEVDRVRAQSLEGKNLQTLILNFDQPYTRR